LLRFTLSTIEEGMGLENAGGLLVNVTEKAYVAQAGIELQTFASIL
jgi:hypothetical protein